MSDIFSPSWAFKEKKAKKQANEYFGLFLQSLHKTEETRQNHRVKIGDLRPCEINDWEDGFEVIDTRRPNLLDTPQSYHFDQSIISQIAGMDNPPFPVAWFKGALGAGKHPLHTPKGTPTPIKVDIRQEIIANLFSKRTRTERYLREEVPFYRCAMQKMDGDPMITQGNSFRSVMGMVGKDYPLEWSTYKMFSAISATLVDTTGLEGVRASYDLPYVNANGTAKMSFTFDKETIKIEPREGDIIQIGGLVYDNPYGRGSFGWYPRTLRLWCSNGAATWMDSGWTSFRHDKLGIMVKKLVNHILTPRMHPDTNEFLDSYEADLQDPHSVAHYLENMDVLYDHLATVMITRFISSQNGLIKKYDSAVSIIIEDYKQSIEDVCKHYDIGKKATERLIEMVAIEESIPDPEIGEEFTLYDLSNVFTAYGRDANSDEQRERYELVGGQLITNPLFARRFSQ